jgi:hypothetical protein
MAEIQSKIEKLELLDGNTVELTLNFKKLLWLRANGHSEEVTAAMHAINGKELDFLEMPYLFYAAYLCAVSEPAYTQDEFIGVLPFDMEIISSVFANLISKKKAEASQMRSSAASRKAK